LWAQEANSTVNFQSSSRLNSLFPFLDSYLTWKYSVMQIFITNLRKMNVLYFPMEPSNQK